MQKIPPQTSALIALWHEHLPLCMMAFRNQGYAVLISKSNDGELAAKLCASWGYRVFRGSTSKGSLSGSKALHRFITDQTRSGKPGLAGMVLDGPRGPYHSISPGAFWLAEKTGLTILHPEVTVTRYITLNNWDQTIIPMPFAKIKISFSKWDSIPKDQKNISKPQKQKILTPN